jgi:signal transduction histidine kinase
LFDEVVAAVRDQCQRQNVAIEQSVPATLCVEADRRQLAAALRHLTVSALSSMPAGGEMVFTVVATPQGVEIEVGDSGPGLLGDELTDPFVPLRNQAAEASGLERAIAQHVASSHGGRASARNCPEGGTALTLFFPARPALKAVG